MQNAVFYDFFTLTLFSHALRNAENRQYAPSHRSIASTSLFADVINCSNDESNESNMLLSFNK